MGMMLRGNKRLRASPCSVQECLEMPETGCFLNPDLTAAGNGRAARDTKERRAAERDAVRGELAGTERRGRWD